MSGSLHNNISKSLRNILTFQKKENKYGAVNKEYSAIYIAWWLKKKKRNSLNTKNIIKYKSWDKFIF